MQPHEDPAEQSPRCKLDPIADCLPAAGGVAGTRRSTASQITASTTTLLAGGRLPCGFSVSLFSALSMQLRPVVFETPFLGAWLGAVFATAIGVTRQSDAIVLGSRVLILALLRVLIPVMLPISAVFVVLVGVVGVKQLDTGLSIALIVIAAAMSASFCALPASAMLQRR